MRHAAADARMLFPSLGLEKPLVGLNAGTVYGSGAFAVPCALPSQFGSNSDFRSTAEFHHFDRFYHLATCLPFASLSRHSMCPLP